MGHRLSRVEGPIKVGVSYRTGGKFICVGASPKTEFFWYDSWPDERDTGKGLGVICIAHSGLDNHLPWVISFTRSKNSFFLGVLILQLTGTTW